ncbi:hypothetical protein BDV23DRAFT_182317 [Aspergillus alliaceus]|uniref:Uncharacterized protein n=1 Tax=Petromyces alliaceus TaxID=209559 RepID=A0A5N6G7B8_PETAA|nr:uncharacterized protein BDW43DRAFT_306968 [Aspergillus alliaceus]KAB8238282.1 hypothetical protein BDW43DRAFT_306968 [Aspergillus alliaceus]KAE8391733.1 hypothetical protein BDV23DRAFT_182317 [Aspergillus alliaceus]
MFPSGRGFSATFGFVIAALVMVVLIQLLATSERYAEKGTANVETTSTEDGMIGATKYTDPIKSTPKATVSAVSS